MRQMHFVVFFSKSILANSFGEWILEKMYVLPTDMQGADNTLAKEYIGPVPAEDTLIIDFPNDSLAASFTCKTNGSEIFVLDAASP